VDSSLFWISRQVRGIKGGFTDTGLNRRIYPKKTKLEFPIGKLLNLITSIENEYTSESETKLLISSLMKICFRPSFFLIISNCLVDKDAYVAVLCWSTGRLQQFLFSREFLEVEEFPRFTDNWFWLTPT